MGEHLLATLDQETATELLVNRSCLTQVDRPTTLTLEEIRALPGGPNFCSGSFLVEVKLSRLLEERLIDDLEYQRLKAMGV